MLKDLSGLEIAKIFRAHGYDFSMRIVEAGGASAREVLVEAWELSENTAAKNKGDGQRYRIKSDNWMDAVRELGELTGIPVDGFDDTDMRSM